MDTLVRLLELFNQHHVIIVVLAVIISAIVAWHIHRKEKALGMAFVWGVCCFLGILGFIVSFLGIGLIEVSYNQLLLASSTPESLTPESFWGLTFNNGSLLLNFGFAAVIAVLSIMFGVAAKSNSVDNKISSDLDDRFTAIEKKLNAIIENAESNRDETRKATGSCELQININSIKSAKTPNRSTVGSILAKRRNLK
ncbi:hypothetical protein [Methanoculleus taiwanensis]|uniref:hypothetical protein n=1 Tax=Methanoculleus taiwanensis TaxID=1550565 RepID=UPI000FFEC964|nr:hypothetical protein [Methanoculleus taiwanensis]